MEHHPRRGRTRVSSITREHNVAEDDGILINTVSGRPRVDSPITVFPHDFPIFRPPFSPSPSRRHPRWRRFDADDEETNVIFHVRPPTRISWNSRPSSTREEHDDYGDREYQAAERLGEQMEGENCHTLYPECRRSVLDAFSTLITWRIVMNEKVFTGTREQRGDTGRDFRKFEILRDCRIIASC